MPLADGTRLGPYEILAPLGAGGMGEVYRARDTRLKREVAIKVLPDTFTADPGRMMRFQREAEVLASLDHPNIGAIHGMVDSDGVRALVLALVEGPTLAVRVAPGPLPLDEALSIARQIVAALEYAHEKGVIHRDLKPANVKITPEGMVKVLDFGLAKVLEEDQPAGSAPDSPTLTLGHTRAGVILGTAAYMSPEQAVGKSADRRSDIFSFGAMLYEMLTGQNAFKGESAPEILVAVARDEPDWAKLPADLPPAIHNLLRRCLTKDRKQRLQAIGEARIVLENPVGQAILTPADSAPSRSRFLYAGWIAAAALAVVAGVALWGWLKPAPAEPRPVVRFEANIPIANTEGNLALSPDGTRLAFVGGPEQLIYVRALDQLEARPIAGTEGAAFLCFSPDGQWISFITSGRPRSRGTKLPGTRLKKVALTGGSPQTLAELRGYGPPFQSWGEDGNILFTLDGKLQRISADGGQAQALAAPDTNRRFFDGAQALPGGRAILLSIALTTGVSAQVVALTARTGEKKVLLEEAGIATFAPAHPGSSIGHILFYAPGTGALMAAPFDAARLELKGSPVPVLEGVHGVTGPFGSFAVSESGTLAYVPGEPVETAASSLVWLDRKGGEQPVLAPARQFISPRISPDGGRVAVELQDRIARRSDVWVYDLARGAPLRLTFDNINRNPVWTPDGKRLIYHSSASQGLVSLPADGSGSPVALLREPVLPDSVSPDGKVLVVRGNRDSATGQATLGTLALAAASATTARSQTLVTAPRFNPSGVFSPDGQWIAYSSNESGRDEVYVLAYPGPGGKYPVSNNGGIQPRWARSGRELFYRRGNAMMAVDVQLGPPFRASKPRVLFEGPYPAGYDVAPDGQRFLMIKLPAEAAPEQPDKVDIIVNWNEELRRRVPLGK